MPGVADLAVGVACLQQAAQLGVAGCGDAPVRGDQQLARPVQRVALVAAVSQGLVQRLCGGPRLGAVSARPHDMERVSDLGRARGTAAA